MECLLGLMRDFAFDVRLEPYLHLIFTFLLPSSLPSRETNESWEHIEQADPVTLRQAHGRWLHLEIWLIGRCGKFCALKVISAISTYKASC